MSNVVTPQAPARPSAKGEPVQAVIAAPARRKPASRDQLVAVLMVTPSIVAIALFVYGFIAWNGWASVPRPVWR